MDVKHLRKIAEEATQTGWEFSGNYPFYVDVRKPASSLSKHDDKRPTYWRFQDGLFVAAFNPKTVLELLDKVESLQSDVNYLWKTIEELTENKT